MTIEIDPGKLRSIAKTAIAQEKTDQEAKDAEKVALDSKRTARINQAAEDLLASIPQELEKAANKPTQTESGIIITAHIPIVREHMTGCFSKKGDLSEDDAAILDAVKAKLTTLNPSDLYSVKVKQHTETHQYISNSGTDDSDPGPCICYELVVTAILPE